MNTDEKIEEIQKLLKELKQELARQASEPEAKQTEVLSHQSLHEDGTMFISRAFKSPDRQS